MCRFVFPFLIPFFHFPLCFASDDVTLLPTAFRGLIAGIAEAFRTGQEWCVLCCWTSSIMINSPVPWRRNKHFHPRETQGPSPGRTLQRGGRGRFLEGRFPNGNEEAATAHLSQARPCLSDFSVIEFLLLMLPLHPPPGLCYKQLVSGRMKQIYRTELTGPEQLPLCFFFF